MTPDGGQWQNKQLRRSPGPGRGPRSIDEIADWALEVSVNGEVVFVIGHRDWVGLGLHLDVGRWTPEVIEHFKSINPDFDDESPTEHAGLIGHGMLPDGEGLGSATGHHYDILNLSLGDQVTVKIIESDNPDEPNYNEPDACGMKIKTLKH